MTTTSNPVPLFSSARVNEPFDLTGALMRVVSSNSFVLGREVAQFEREFAAYVGAGHCVSVANGSDALELALRALGAGPGSRVVCVANAGFYSSTAINLVGAAPLFVDVDEDTLTMSARGLESALAQRPTAVIATHLYGQLADVEAIAVSCREAGVPLIEDCAQSHGACRGGRRAGTWGDLACFSFYPTKNLGALGDGGAVVTGDAQLAERVKALRQYGWSRKYEVATLNGRNSRLDEMQAAVLREKLPGLDSQNAQRRHIAARYNAAFAGLPLRLPKSTGGDHVAHLYVVRSPQREALRRHLQSQGVGCDVHYPIADTRQPAWQGGFEAIRLPVSQEACDTVLSLPCFPGLPADSVGRVVRAVTSFFQPAGD